MNMPHRTILPALWSDAFRDAVAPEPGFIGFHRAEPGWLSPVRHTVMPDFDLWYVAVGGGAVFVNGRWLTFSAGDLLCLKPGDVYERERADAADPFQVYFAHLLPFGAEDRGLNRALTAAWPLKLPVQQRPEILGLFDRLFEAYATQPGNRSLTVKGLLLQILDVVFEELRLAPAARRTGSHPGLLKARAFLEAEFAAEVRLGDVAAAADLSSSHLSALFKRQFGVSPIEHLLRVRLREAKLLLARGLRIKDVASRTGFRSQHYFCRLFHRRTGTTPTAFARAARRRGPGPA
jgi:AraC-like DNA-binding protein